MAEEEEEKDHGPRSECLLMVQEMADDVASPTPLQDLWG